MITLYHNPDCSKSREALAILEGFSRTQNLTLEVIDYQKNPLNALQLSQLHQQLAQPVHHMLRNNEAIFTELNLATANETTLLNALVSYPHLLQRPLVTWRGQALIARPTEHLPAWLRNIS